MHPENIFAKGEGPENIYTKGKEVLNDEISIIKKFLERIITVLEGDEILNRNPFVSEICEGFKKISYEILYGSAGRVGVELEAQKEGDEIAIYEQKQQTEENKYSLKELLEELKDLRYKLDTLKINHPEVYEEIIKKINEALPPEKINEMLDKIPKQQEILNALLDLFFKKEIS